MLHVMRGSNLPRIKPSKVSPFRGLLYEVELNKPPLGGLLSDLISYVRTYSRTLFCVTYTALLVLCFLYAPNPKDLELRTRPTGVGKNTPYGVFSRTTHALRAKKIPPMGVFFHAHGIFSSKKIPPMRHFSSKKIPPMELRFSGFEV